MRRGDGDWLRGLATVGTTGENVRSMRLLLAGDIHIGRSSTRLPDQVDRAALRAESAWDRIVETAIAERCDVLLLSGDVTDGENRFWEAIGPLERGIRQLANAGIRTVAVSGNHDHGVLGRLADTFDPADFLLLGRGGSWQRETIFDSDGGPGARPLLHIDGWSFPREEVRDDPMASYALPRVDDAPMLGLVHGDLDDRTSPYAPLRETELRSTAHAGWLLGHIHKPRFIESDGGGPWILYPGSPQALDPGEPGVHGAWIVEVEAGRLGVPRPLPLSTVRYEAIEFDVSAIEYADEIDSSLVADLRDRTESFGRESGPSLEHVVLRLAITGATMHREAVVRSIDGLLSSSPIALAGQTLVIERADDRTMARLHLVDVARSTSALGIAARILVALDHPTTVDADARKALARLLTTVRRRILELRNRAHFGPLTVDPLDETSLRELVRAHARRLLTALAEQSSGLATNPLTGARGAADHGPVEADA